MSSEEIKNNLFDFLPNQVVTLLTENFSDILDETIERFIKGEILFGDHVPDTKFEINVSISSVLMFQIRSLKNGFDEEELLRVFPLGNYQAVVQHHKELPESDHFSEN